jgi:hypothetical protein
MTNQEAGAALPIVERELIGAYMLGSCRNGNESDKGELYHAVGGWKALCGKQPGRRSAGWQLFPDLTVPLPEVNCPRCRALLAKLEAGECNGCWHLGEACGHCEICTDDPQP